MRSIDDYPGEDVDDDDDDEPRDLPHKEIEKLLGSSREDERRWAIIDVSRRRLKDFESQLLTQLPNETPDNRRHIVRAIGRLAAVEHVPLLLSMLASEQGLMLGDVAEALGRLKAKEAVCALEELKRSPIDWVSSKARWAVREIQRSHR